MDFLVLKPLTLTCKGLLSSQFKKKSQKTMPRANWISKGQLEDSEITLPESRCCLADSVSRCLLDPPKAVLLVSFE